MDKSINRFYSLLNTATRNVIAGQAPTAYIFGTVTSADPIKISIGENIELQKENVLLTSAVSDIVVDVEITDDDIWESEPETEHIHSYYDSDTGDNASGSATRNTDPTTHTHEIKGEKKITILNALKVNEKVILLRVHGGTKYIVLDRLRTEPET